MSTLKVPLKPFDSIMDKIDKSKVYTVLHETVHDVWVWREGEGPQEMPKRMINMAYIKVDPRIAKVLYAEKNDNSSDSTNDSESKS